MKKTLLLVIAALMVPSVALAAKPAHGPKPPKPGAQMTYELKGTLSNYTAYDAGTSTNGAITIVVSSASHHGKALKGQTLTFAVDANTTVSLKSGLSGITNGDYGMVKVHAAAKIPPADLAATLQASPAAKIFDRGVKPPHMVTYVLAGTLSSYTAYDSVTPANGTVTILVKHAMPHAKSLKGQTLVFAIDANTKVSLGHKLTTITDGDKGLVMVRAAAGILPADLAATLQAAPAKHVVDPGAKHKH
jgi:hypothetical protein